MAMKKPDDAQARPGNTRAVSDSEFVSSFPRLHDYMCESKWEDGTPRSTSTLMLVIEDGGWKGCLNDRALERSLWRAGASIHDCLEAIEAALASDTSDWRRWQKQHQKRR